MLVIGGLKEREIYSSGEVDLEEKTGKVERRVDDERGERREMNL